MDVKKLEERYRLLTEFFEVREKLRSLDNILGTHRDDPSKRNIGGFLVSAELYFSIYEQIKSEYKDFYNVLKSELEQND